MGEIGTNPERKTYWPIEDPVPHTEPVRKPTHPTPEPQKEPVKVPA